MRLLLPIVSVLALATAFDTSFSLFDRQTSICQILPIAATPYNGEISCGGGSVDGSTGCICCPDGVTPCSEALQTCQPSGGGYICVDDTPLGGSDCAAQGLAACGNGCMPIGGNCCSDGNYCPSNEKCGTLADGSGGCFPLDSSSAAPTTPTTGSSAPSTTAETFSSTTAASAPSTTAEKFSSTTAALPGTTTSSDSSTFISTSTSIVDNTASAAGTSSSGPTPSNMGSKLGFSPLLGAGAMVPVALLAL